MRAKMERYKKRKERPLQCCNEEATEGWGVGIGAESLPLHACMHTYIYVCMHIHTYMHACMHACIHTYMHACMHAYIHTYIHTHTHINSSGASPACRC